MARRNTAAATEAEQTPTPEVTETVTEDTASETPVENTEGGETEGGESTEDTKPEVKEIDLTAFQAAVAEAIKEQDESTGELPLAAIEPVNVEYRKLDGTKAKNQAKTWCEDRMKAALMGTGDYTAPNLPDARSYVQIKDSLTAAKAGTKEQAPADPVAAFVNRSASLVLAQSIVKADAPEVEGDRDLDAEVEALASSLAEQVEAYSTWLKAETPEGEDKPDAPEVSPVVKSAFKLASGKAAGTRAGGSGSGKRRDVAKHITEAFASVEPGEFLSVAAIAKFDSEEYRDGDKQDHPSQGAVQARLFPESGKCTVEGVEPIDRGVIAEGSPRGARKAA